MTRHGSFDMAASRQFKMNLFFSFVLAQDHPVPSVKILHYGFQQFFFTEFPEHLSLVPQPLYAFGETHVEPHHVEPGGVRMPDSAARRGPDSDRFVGERFDGSGKISNFNNALKTMP